MRLNTIKILLLLLGLLVIFIYSSSIYMLASHHIKTDFTLTYLSGKLLNAHVPGYQFSKDYLLTHQVKTNIIPNLSPPFTLILTALVAKYLNYKTFFSIFITASIFINVFALTRLYQHFYPKKNTSQQSVFLYAFILMNLIFIPTFVNISYGQLSLLLNTLLIFSYLALVQKKEILAGFLLALATNIKLFFGLFVIYFLAQKRYYAFFSFVSFCLLFATIPLLIYGSSIYIGYFKTLTAVSWYGINWNASFYGFLCRVIGDPNHRFHALLSFPKITKWTYYIVFATYITLIYFFSRKDKYSSALAFSFTLSSMLLISPLGWNYYFPILVTALLINLKDIELNRYSPLLICLMIFSFFLSALPFPMYTNDKIKAFDLITQGNNDFLALLIFNFCTLVQLFSSKEKNNAPIFTTKHKTIILCICLFPSLVGLCSITAGSFAHINTHTNITDN